MEPWNEFVREQIRHQVNAYAKSNDTDHRFRGLRQPDFHAAWNHAQVLEEGARLRSQPRGACSAHPVTSSRRNDRLK